MSEPMSEPMSEKISDESCDMRNRWVLMLEIAEMYAEYGAFKKLPQVLHIEESTKNNFKRNFLLGCVLLSIYHRYFCKRHPISFHAALRSKVRSFRQAFWDYMPGNNPRFDN